LQEFRTALMRPVGRLGGTRTLSPESPSLPAGDWSRPGPYADNSTQEKLPPNTAPLPAPTRLSSSLAVNPELATIRPGPSSAPSGVAWPSHDDRLSTMSQHVPLKSQDAAYVDPSGHVIPVVKIIEEPHADEPEVSRAAKDRPRSLNLDNHSRHDSGRHVPTVPSSSFAEFAMGPLHPSEEVAPADTFGLMSPTTTEFQHSPLDRDTLLGTLGMGTVIQNPNQPRHLPVNTEESSLSSKREKAGKNVPLRPKLSSPSLREQRELEAIQSQLQASRTQHTDAEQAESAGLEALMSPRAFEFTQNPFAVVSEVTQTTAAVSGGDDPRSPPQKGVSPITRKIFDVL